MKQNWEYKKLGELATEKLAYGSGASAIEYDGKNRYVRITDITDEGNLNEDFKSPSVFEKKYLLNDGDLLFARSGATVGKTYLHHNTNYSCIYAGYLIRFVPNKEKVLPNFVFYYTKSPVYKTFVANSQNAVAQPNINAQQYSNLLIPVPPLSTQTAIVSELDALSAIIADHKSLLKKYDELEQSIFYDMFGDPVKNEKGWEEKKLGEISNVKIGPFGSLLHKQDYISDGIPLVNPIHMKNYKVVVDRDFTISEEKAKELEGYILKENDVILARRGDIGRCAIVTKAEDGFLCGTGSLFVRFNSEISPAYVMYVVRSESFSRDLISKATGATMLNLNASIVSNLEFPLPPLPLQQAFASKIEAIESMKADTKKSLAKSEELFNARMDYYFNT